MDPNRTYTLLLGDLKNSTSLDPAVATRLVATKSEALKKLNSNYHPVLGLSISYGDEIAGLFEELSPLYAVMNRLRDVMRNHGGIRFVVSEGRIGCVHDDIRQIGGPIFKAANNEMQKLKTAGHSTAWKLEDKRLAQILTSLCNLNHAMIDNMTDYQYKVFQMKRNGMSQKQIADKLGKFAQSVSDAATRGNIDLVLQAEETIGIITKECCKDKIGKS